jgi:cell fate (sporulation/competence/biofilm development) regulator YmcA (YheA/YmcA/DUF963 family)
MHYQKNTVTYSHYTKNKVNLKQQDGSSIAKINIKINELSVAQDGCRQGFR